MPPRLSKGIDHVHVYVRNRADAARWYEQVLGFRPVARYLAWAEDPHGPLTIESPGGNIHLALFANDKPRTDVIAFGATGDEWLQWRDHLTDLDVDLRLRDHDLAVSLYFADPDGNVHEITTYDVERVRGRL